MREEVLNQLQTNVLGRTIHEFPITGSTNDEAIRRAKEGGVEGELFLADQQTAGRGRMGRHWESPAGKNLYFSILLRPRLTPKRASTLTLAAGVAIHESLTPLLPPSLGTGLTLKWPNDLYLGDKKVAGILSEMESQGDRVTWVVLGIGIDVNNDPSDFSPEVQEIATSLKTGFGREFDRAAILSRFLKVFEDRYEELIRQGPALLIQYCNQYSYLQGKRVFWRGVEGEVRGIAGPLTDLGALSIRADTGKMVLVLSGDVLLEER